MAAQDIKAERFRAMHIPGDPLILFNVWDAGSAKAVAAAGAKVIATSSWAVANANGFADGEKMPLNLAIANLRRIVDVVDLPVSVDLESGYGATPQEAADAVRLAIEAGAAGCNLEDSFPANGKLRQIPDQCSRIRATRQASDATGVRIFINARTDVFFQTPVNEHSHSMVNRSLERAHAYAKAGADGLFVPGLTSIELIAELVGLSPLPVNIMVGDATPSLSVLAKHGVARVSHGPRPYLLAMKALQEGAGHAAGEDELSRASGSRA